MSAFEVNFDGLVGPTHNYAGLSRGNIASVNNAFQDASPKQAAKQGLQKMQALHDMGFKQAVLPPHERPAIDILRQLGFSGDDANVIKNASAQQPALFLNCCSASSMWVANAATVSPSADTADQRVHLTPANLSNKFHRSIEHPVTRSVLQAIFADSTKFIVHPALPAGEHFSDEGAANHTRLCDQYGDRGVEVFVYGRSAFGNDRFGPGIFPARQSLEASQSIARLHGLAATKTVYAQQNPEVIDAGVFHNDVIAVGNGRLLLYHEKAFLNSEQTVSQIRQAMVDVEPIFIQVKQQEVDVATAIKSYLFNSQLLTVSSEGQMLIIAPKESEENENVSSCLQRIVDDAANPITAVHYFDLRESMQNGGGPACLRLRVVLSDAELAAINPAVIFNEVLHAKLDTWIDKHYRDRIGFDDLRDPQLLFECRAALDELTQILNLGPVYSFQKN